MQMSLEANSLPTCWLRQPTMAPSHPQNDTVYEDPIRHVSPYEKEPMFEKPLTPSDVGKLNRLVIPKQHAERHFPLGAAAADASETLLGFEDESGKPWRFRYSYWNSSQSYVLTKGWSRYVKEKRLDAGDVVFFERHRNEPDRLFIGWRRRGEPAAAAFCYNAQGFNNNYQAHDSRDQLRAAAGAARGVAEAEAEGPNNRRLVRLFGVNLECQHDNPETTSSEGSFWSNQQQQQQQQAGNGYYFDYGGQVQPTTSTHHPHHSYHLEQEMNFPQGVNWMGNGLG